MDENVFISIVAESIRVSKFYDNVSDTALAKDIIEKLKDSRSFREEMKKILRPEIEAEIL